ncbi:Coatomer beta subunit [Senna tora]|uniref:Coatomer beta subunit n=1 Tax=Senna tora TaxID=362788 RepID=A0A834SS05_9FABA|nr:Coatomer beta subunit [Senna tora]
MADSPKLQPPQILQVLQALKQASHDLQAHPSLPADDPNSAAIKALLELHTESDAILSDDPNLSSLSHHLTDLKNLVDSLRNTKRGLSLLSFLSRRVSAHSVSRIAGSIESEIQKWIDRESLGDLSRALREPIRDDDEELVKLLIQFEERVSLGFNRELQDLVLRFRVFSSLESILCDPKCSKRIREHSAFAIAALIRFNKDVFVGQVLMGPTICALTSMASANSIQVLCSLIRSIKSPIVDEIESNGEIPKIISFLNSQDLQMRVLAMDCVLEIGYFGRKEAVEAMLKEGIIKKLVELQRSELGGDLIDLGRRSEEEGEESHPFASCVARFAVQLEVGEGLRQRERRAFKQGILQRVREASISDAEAATIVAEVLWGSSP